MLGPDENEPSATVIKAVAGDASAFGQLVTTHSAKVTGIAYSILGDFSLSEDVGQEAFLEAWKKREELRDPSKFASWVGAIARHRSLDLARRVRSQRETTDQNGPAAESIDTPSASERLETEEEKALVWDSLASLPEKYREAIVLYYRGNESVAEVAVTTGQSEANVRQRLARGRQLLKGEVERTVQRTLSRTAPGVVFTAAVLGSLPGNASAAIAGSTAINAMAATGKTVASTKVTQALAAGSLAALSGAAIGTLGGLAGAGLGSWLSYRQSPFASQRRAIVRLSIWMLVAMLLFSVLIAGLVWKQRSPTPIAPKNYAVILLSVIGGFQLFMIVVVLLFMRHYKKLGRTGVDTGETIEPDFAVRQVSAPIEESNSNSELSSSSDLDLNKKRGSAKIFSPARSWTSPQTIWGRPLIDIQHGERDICGFVEHPATARGWIAIGDRAYGRLLACGSRAVGFIAIGSFCLGVVTFGAVGLGVVSLGGISLGLLACGGLTLGWVSMGGLALGWNCLGGLAAGWHALGGAAFGIQSASGGVAWCRGDVAGGLILGGTPNADLRPSEFSQTKWLSEAIGFAQIGGESTWHQMIAIALVVLFVIAVVAAVAIRRAVSPPRSGHSVIATAIERNDLGSVLGSMIGCTFWPIGMAMNHGRSDLAFYAGIPYCIAIGISFAGYQTLRDRGRTRDIMLTGIGCIYFAAMCGLVLMRFNGINSYESLRWSTILAILQIMVIGHLALTFIVTAERTHSSPG